MYDKQDRSMRKAIGMAKTQTVEVLSPLLSGKLK
jgi:hypothetical protein